MKKSRVFSVGALLISFLVGCASESDLSGVAPYSNYAGKTVPLVTPLPLEYDFQRGEPSKVVPVGSLVAVRRVFLEKSYLSGPIIPGWDVSTQIFAVVEYIDPVTKDLKERKYSLGVKLSPRGYAEKILVAPWEPLSTPPLRYVGKDGKRFAG
jgi:hypothetical protein